MTAEIEALIARRPNYHDDKDKLAEWALEADFMLRRLALTVPPTDEQIGTIRCDRCGERAKVTIRSARITDAAPQQPPAPPVAWLHSEHTTAYVITERVKDIWLKVDPKHVEHYTIPLYTKP